MPNSISGRLGREKTGTLNKLTTTELREKAVIHITSLMTIVICIAAILIAGGTLVGFFDFLGTLPIYILLFAILPAWIGAKHGGWRWAGFFPTVLCFGLGIYGSLSSGFLTLFVLFYALSVILAGMLIGNWAGLVLAMVSAVAYSGIGAYSTGFSIDDLPVIITFTFGIASIALLLWYANSNYHKALKSQVMANQLLNEEVMRREILEAAHLEQDSQIRLFAENTSDVITKIDPDGKIQYASPSYQSILGYDPQSLVGTNAFDLIHPDDISIAMESVQDTAKSYQPGRIQTRVRCADTHYIWFEISGTPLYDDLTNFSGLVLSGRDITLQKQAEMANQASEKKFRTIVEALPLGIHLYTLEDGQLIFTGYNRAANQILGIDHEQFIGKTIDEAFPGLEALGVAPQYRKIAGGGGLWVDPQVNYQSKIIQGNYEVHAFQTEPGKMAAAFEDITQRLMDNDALQLSEKKFSTAFLTSPDSININRLVDGVFIDINQGFSRLMGYTREESIGKSSVELNIWENPKDRALLVIGLKEKGVVENLEAKFRRKNGEIAVGLMSARIIRIQGEDCILSITRDITEWNKTQIELRNTHKQLEEAYEMTLKGWAQALELRERETANHSRRVVELTLQMARSLEISGAELTHLERGALLHDIGKMGVPDHILLKPGPLSPDEWVTMKQHPDYARMMLMNIEYLHPTIPIPYSHHERWDGSGYPLGLKGEEIPLAARIFAIVDVYDALTHDRPYRKAWTSNETKRYLSENAGTMFDPALVDLFLQIT